MFKFHFSWVLALFTFFSIQHLEAQCPQISVSATDICPNYSGFCGCDNSVLSYTLPNNVSYLDATLHYYSNGQAIATASTSSPGSFPSLESYGNTLTFRDWSIGSGVQYYLVFQLDINGVTTTCYSDPFTINAGSSNAVPTFKTHALPLTNVMFGGQQFVNTVFYANDPITFDAHLSQNVFEYILDCTPVNSSGTPTGAVVTNWNTFYPSASNFMDYYTDLRASFSNLVNPTGMVANLYYRIRMHAIGCSGNTIIYEKIIRVNHAARSVKEGPMLMNVSPNPSTGIVNLAFEETQENVVLTIQSMEGKEVLRREESNSKRMTIDLSDQTKGMYILSLETQEGRTTEKIVIQ